MTVTAKKPRKIISGSGWANPLTHDFRLENSSHLHVYADDDELTLGVDYTVSFDPAVDGYEVTLLDADLEATVFVLWVDSPLTQDDDVSLGGAFGLRFENAVDKLTRRVQSLEDAVDRSFKVPLTNNPLTLDQRDIVVPEYESGKLLGWSSTPKRMENKIPIDLGLVVDVMPYVATKTIVKESEFINGVLYDKSTGDVFIPTPKTGFYDVNLGVTFNDIAQVDGESNVRISTFNSTIAWVRDKFLKHHTPMAASWFGMIGDGSVSGTDMLTYMGYSWEVMKRIQRVLKFPGGDFGISGQFNYPFRQSVVASLLQVNAGIIAQPDTIFRTSAPNGADVFQLNGLSHFFIRGRPLLKSTITGVATQGSNGVSITNGGEELEIDVACLNLPAVNTGTNLDGGSGGTIQMGSTALGCGRIRMQVRTKGCGHGFSYAGTPTNMATKKLDAHVEVHSEDGYRGAVVSNGALTGAVDDTFADGLTINLTSVNDQQGLVLGRSFGGDFRIACNSNKTAAAKRLMPDGATQWRGGGGTPDTDVVAVRALMGHKSRIVSTGRVGECDYIYDLGGATSGHASQDGHSEQLWMHMGVTGTPATSAIKITNSGGNTVRNSHFEIDPKSVNRASLPAEIVNGTKGNTYRMLDGLRDDDQNTNSSDGNVTLAPTSDRRNQLFTATLTADRTVTLSTTSAYRGQEWEISRTGGGNFQLIIGASGALGALGTGEGVLVRFDGTNWYIARRWRISTPQGTDIVDADITLNPHAHAPKQLQSTALTADRTVTLGTTNAVAGDEFDIRRSTAAGAFRLIITGLGSVGPGEYLRAVYSGSGWVVGDRGTITETFTTISTDSAETINVHAQGNMVAHTGTLTADRTITLSTTGAGAGDIFYIKRTGGGAFNLSINGTKNLATNQWCIMKYSGGAWVLFAFGSL